MRRSLWASGSLLILTLAVFVCPTSATILMPLSDHELTDRAHVVVIGRAIAHQTVWVGQNLTTLVTVSVSESLKGGAPATVTVALPGGIDRNRKIPIEILYVGAPRILVDEEVLLFLEHGRARVYGAYVVSGFSQGKLSVVADDAGVKRVSRSPRHDQPAGTPNAKHLDRLSDFREKIRLQVKGGRP